jgi:hypothetical protein
MSWRKKVNPKNNKNISIAFGNWLSQMCLMILPRFLYMVSGRGSAKTTDIQVERLIEMIYDMPGAPVAWVADTYANLQKNVLRTVQEGLLAKGLVEGVHYVVGKRPLEYSLSEMPDLSPAIKEHFWRPYNQLSTYNNTLIFFTGFNITFGSLDRPASLAGGNYVHVFGDEVKYFRKDRISNLQKAVRGMRVKYGNSPFYRGHTFTTDMPNTDLIGQHDWILERGKRMKASALLLVLRTAMVLNDALGQYILAAENGDREEIAKKKRTWKRWEERWTTTRLHPDAHTMFYIASSYVNVDILTPEWFDDAFSDDWHDSKTTVLSIKPKPDSGELFYANLLEKHFYMDGSDPDWSARFGLQDEEDCRILKYHDRNKAIDAGVDFGNMISMSLAQQDQQYYRVSKFIYTLSPEWVRELADKFIKFYKPHREKTLNLYYDRAANNYKKAGQDLATQLKKALEYDADGNKTGWKVVLMSEGQGNIFQNEEYNFMMEALAENNKRLPKLRIDFYHCKPLRCSLELAKLRKRTDKGKTVMAKDKRSEQLPIHRLPLESTNASDSFKYLVMKKSLRRMVGGVRRIEEGDAKVR